MKNLQFLLASIFAAVLLLAAGCTKTPDTGPDPDPAPEVKPDKESADAAIDKWMFDYMQKNYLWNSAVKATTPDYTLDYEPFLNDVLKKVAEQNDINHDDGHWSDGKRQYFYSNVQRYPAGTLTNRASASTRGGLLTDATGFGIEMLYYAALDQTRTYYGLVPAVVHPDGPAAKAGLKRGDIISKVNGDRITSVNRNTLWEELIYGESGTKTLTLYDPNSGDESTVRITAASYADNPVFAAKTLRTASGKKVGYLLYNAFNYYYDDKLIEAFNGFSKEGVEAVVLDLRYNGGGHVLSSAVLGTLIAGEAHKGEIYSKASYNADRRNEPVDIYKIGEAVWNPGYSNTVYQPIADALAASVDLSEVYVLCTGSTASASELVINGLRGIGLNVHLIGETTNGKNVGMEAIIKQFGQYDYDFSPITFYSENAQGFKDYGNGFAPDLECEDSPWWYVFNGQGKLERIERGELGNPERDEMLDLTMDWIERGSKPVLTASALGTRASKAPNRAPYQLLRCGVNRRHPQAMIRLTPEQLQ